MQGNCNYHPLSLQDILEKNPVHAPYAKANSFISLRRASTLATALGG